MMPSSREVDHDDYQLITSPETHKKSGKREFKKQSKSKRLSTIRGHLCTNVVPCFIFASKLGPSFSVRKQKRTWEKSTNYLRNLIA
jgi:hypothetical protein